MDDDVAMQDVVKRLDITCVTSGQPAGDERRTLLHAPIISCVGGGRAPARTPAGSRTAPPGMVAWARSSAFPHRSPWTQPTTYSPICAAPEFERQARSRRLGAGV